MTSELTLTLSSGTTITATNNDGTTFSWTPTNCGTNNACAMNGNTAYNSARNKFYYSWYAATADTGTSSMTESDGDTTGSICPKNWRLPANYSVSQTKSFGTMTDAYGFTVNGGSASSPRAQLETFPFDFYRWDHYQNGGLVNYPNYNGLYWSSTPYNTRSI